MLKAPSPRASGRRISHAGGRARRQGGVHNILLMNLSRQAVIPGDRTLGEYFSLKVMEISEKQGVVPSVLQHLVFKHYNIGPSGCLIGTGTQCHIRLPAQALTEEVHAEIVWNKERRRFMLQDRARKMSNEQLPPVHFPLELAHGQEFVTGRITWKVIALPSDIVFNLQLFSAARSGKLSLLRQCIESEEEASKKRHSSEEQRGRYSIVEYLQVADSNQKLQHVLTEGIDINIVDEGDCHSNVVPTAKMLLHVAIEIDHKEMIQYLLDKGADVNRCVGDLGLNALHIAARCNKVSAMEMLLSAGGDVELLDRSNNNVLSWTTSYEIRCMILHSTLLCCAAYEGDISMVEQLLQTTRACPNALGLKHKNALHHASFAGHEAIVSLLLQRGAHVDAVGGSHDRTALHYASVADHVGVAKILKENNANLKVKDKNGYTAINLTKGGEMCQLLHQGPLGLCEAVQEGNLDKVNKLLNTKRKSVGQDRIFDQRNEQGHAPLHIACVLGFIDHVKLLVEHGADVNLIGGSNQWTPLFYAAVSGHQPLVELLLEIGADPQMKDVDGSTVRQVVERCVEELEKRRDRPPVSSVIQPPLVIDEGYMVVDKTVTEKRLAQLRSVLDHLTSPVEKLLKALDDKDLIEFSGLLNNHPELSNTLVDTGEHDRMSVLCIACELGAYLFVEQLLEHGAKPSEDALENNCPLHVSCYNGHTDVVRLLVNHPLIRINQQALDTQSTALHIAASENFLEVTELLLQFKADPNIQNADGERPYDCTRIDAIRSQLATGVNQLLWNAAIGDTQTVCKLITNQNITVDAESLHGNTALHEASRFGNLGVVQQLLKHGANINKRSGKSGYTALHFASAANKIPIVELLLAEGAKRDVKDMEGKVPFEVASSHNMRKVLMKGTMIYLPQPREPNLNLACVIHVWKRFVTKVTASAH
ncbi:ankyrin-3-like isoform X2 [Dysidea avara]|uniref:ankyrin-3-like isoform X2 n=1 Tax=Dysidea avara TaxID=196820 RepID=UPI00331B4D8D